MLSWGGGGRFAGLPTKEMFTEGTEKGSCADVRGELCPSVRGDREMSV